MPSLMEGGIY